MRAELPKDAAWIDLYFHALENGLARNVNVAFTINNRRRFTLRTSELPEIRTFFSNCARNAGDYPNAPSMLLGLVATRLGLMESWIIWPALRAKHPTQHSKPRTQHYQ